jgi:hypothetical protein
MLRRTLATLVCLTVAAGLLCAQSAPKLEFEVASIPPSPPINGQFTGGVHIDRAQVNYVLLSLRDYLRAAYKVKLPDYRS